MGADSSIPFTEGEEFYDPAQYEDDDEIEVVTPEDIDDDEIEVVPTNPFKNAHCGMTTTKDVPYTIKELEAAYKLVHPEFVRVPVAYRPNRKRAFYCQKLKEDIRYALKVKELVPTKKPQEWSVDVKPCVRSSCGYQETGLTLEDYRRSWIQAWPQTENRAKYALTQVKEDLSKLQKDREYRRKNPALLRDKRAGEVALFCSYLRRGGKKLRTGASDKEKRLHEIQQRFCGIMQEDLERIDLRKHLNSKRFQQLIAYDSPEEFQQHIAEIFSAFKIPEITQERIDYAKKSGETGCTKKSSIPNVLKLLEYQNFARYYFAPYNPLKGLLLWWAVGRGKTCAAVAALSFAYAKGYNVLWVTRKSLLTAPLKNMFQSVCDKAIRDVLNSGTKDGEALRKKLENIKTVPVDESGRPIGKKGETEKRLFSQYIGPHWSGHTRQKHGKGAGIKDFGHRVITYKQFQHFCSKKKKYKTWSTDMGLSSEWESDKLKKTIVVIDEAHNLYNNTDLSEEEMDFDKTTGTPDAGDIEQTIWHSYAKSKGDSCKVLLLTGTPILADGEPTSLFKLLNLMKDPTVVARSQYQGALPIRLDKIQDRYNIKLRADGKHLEMGNRDRFMRDAMGLMSCVLGDTDPLRIAQPQLLNSDKPARIVEASYLQYNQIRSACYKMAPVKARKPCKDIKSPAACGNSKDPECRWRGANKKKGIEKLCMDKDEHERWFQDSANKEKRDLEELSALIDKLMPLPKCPRAKKACGHSGAEHCLWENGKCVTDKKHERYDPCSGTKMKDCKSSADCSWYGKVNGKNVGCVSQERARRPVHVSLSRSGAEAKAKANAPSNKELQFDFVSNGEWQCQLCGEIVDSPADKHVCKKVYPDLGDPPKFTDKKKRQAFDNCVKDRSMFAFDKNEQRKYNPTDNWYRDKAKNMEHIRKSYKERSPKLSALMAAIAKRDEEDLRESGKLYKHVIYTDVKNPYYGVKLLTSIFLAEGYEIAKLSRKKGGRGQGKEQWTVNPPRLNGPEKTMKKSFVSLSSGGMSGPVFFEPGSVGYRQGDAPSSDDKTLFKQKVFDAYNNRKGGASNVYGENIRFLLMDKGFKEGVDIYDAKYMWILEPPASKASLTQAVGRVLRLCGAAGLPYDEWKVYITVLASRLPTKDRKLTYHLTVDEQQRKSAAARLLFLVEGRNAAADKLLMEAMHGSSSAGADPKRAIESELGIP